MGTGEAPRSEQQSGYPGLKGGREGAVDEPRWEELCGRVGPSQLQCCCQKDPQKELPCPPLLLPLSPSWPDPIRGQRARSPLLGLIQGSPLGTELEGKVGVGLEGQNEGTEDTQLPPPQRTEASHRADAYHGTQHSNRKT